MMEEIRREDLKLRSDMSLEGKKVSTADTFEIVVVTLVAR